jgi:methionine synthase I (cobalamin-dependent)
MRIGDLLTFVNQKEYIILDGAMGTLLMERGLNAGKAPEIWNIDKPEIVGEVHKNYIEAGAKVILTNSFGGNWIRLHRHNMEEKTYQLNKAAAVIADKQAKISSEGVIVAGSVGPSGELIKPYGSLKYEDVRESFKEQIRGLVDGGVDVIWIETMSDLVEVNAAIEAARSLCGLPIIVTLSFDSSGATMMGVHPKDALISLREKDLFAIGANCGKGPEELIESIKQMHETDSSIRLVAKANAGIPKLLAGQVYYDGTPEIMAVYAREVKESGAKFIGACCGSTPEHIRAMANALV